MTVENVRGNIHNNNVLGIKYNSWKNETFPEARNISKKDEKRILTILIDLNGFKFKIIINKQTVAIFQNCRPPPFKLLDPLCQERYFYVCFRGHFQPSFDVTK